MISSVRGPTRRAEIHHAFASYEYLPGLEWRFDKHSVKTMPSHTNPRVEQVQKYQGFVKRRLYILSFGHWHLARFPDSYPYKDQNKTSVMDCGEYPSRSVSTRMRPTSNSKSRPIMNKIHPTFQSHPFLPPQRLYRVPKRHRRSLV